MSLRPPFCCLCRMGFASTALLSPSPASALLKAGTVIPDRAKAASTTCCVELGRVAAQTADGKYQGWRRSTLLAA
jgi:hypothetical protein